MNKSALKKIKSAALDFAGESEKRRNFCLLKLREIIKKNERKIIEANKKDLAIAKTTDLSAPIMERLKLDSKKITQLLCEIKKIIKLESGIGNVLESKILANKLNLRKIAVPIGVILTIYESRPEVTINVASLCLKSGNAVILKGGSEAKNTNKELFFCLQKALLEAKIDPNIIAFVEDRSEIKKLLKENAFIDLVIARGSYELVKTVQRQSKIPILAHSAGGARIYVDKSADLIMAKKIILNAKKNKPSACNSLDTVLVHEAIFKDFVPMLVKELRKNQIEVLGDAKTKIYCDTRLATKQDWAKEFLSLKVAIKSVKNLTDAISFINLYTKNHSEAIIASDEKVIKIFSKKIDAAAIFVNCSTRLHDGYIFGLGSEMGISTGKFHARGPVGLKELLTYKWEMYGNGQIRK